MGGSVVVRSCPRLIEKRYRIVGVAVLDVVEGNHTYTLRTILLNSDSFIVRLRCRSSSSHEQPAKCSSRWIWLHRGGDWVAVSKALLIWHSNQYIYVLVSLPTRFTMRPQHVFLFHQYFNLPKVLFCRISGEPHFDRRRLIGWVSNSLLRTVPN